MIPEVAVYRCYDADGALLYIGVTTDVKRRMQLHASNKRSPWVARVARVEHEWYEDRVDALLAERLATVAESPEFPSTVVGNAANASALVGIRNDARIAGSWKRSATDVFVDLVQKLTDTGYTAGAMTPPKSTPFDDVERDRRHMESMNEAMRHMVDVHGFGLPQYGT